MIALLALLACQPAPVDTGDPGTDPDTEPDTEAPPADLDGDGHLSDVDCDDLDPTAHPGAEEVWDGDDEDCDGRADADGAYAGAVVVDATAIYEGRPRSWRLSCPTTLTRASSRLDLRVSCAPDPADPLAVLLLGEELWVEEDDNVASGAAWAGAVVVGSSAGWEAAGQAALSWPDMDRTDLTFSLDTVSLDLHGGGEVVAR